MKTSGIFRIHEHQFKFKNSSTPISLYPVGDVHYGFGMHCDKAFRKYIDPAKKDPNAYILWMGDVLEFCSTSERNALKAIQLHQSTSDAFRSALEATVDKFIDEYEWAKDKSIGLISGNHYVDWGDNTTSDDSLAKAFGCKNLGVMGLIRLRFECQGRHAALDLCAYHGKGAARLLGSSLNTVQQMAEQIDADVYLQGHDHKRGAIPGERVRLSNDSHAGLILKDRTVYFCRTGGFLRSMVDGKASYNVDSGRGPLPLGGIKLEFWPRRERGGDADRFWIETKVVV